MLEKVIKFVKRHNVLFFTLIAALIGIITFIAIYGIEVINVENTSWLNLSEDKWLHSNGDLTQHYYGWVFFRNSDWSFPIRTI